MRLLIIGGIASAFLAANPFGIPGLPKGIASLTGATSISQSGSKWTAARPRFSHMLNVSYWTGPKIRTNGNDRLGAVHSIASASAAELERKRGLASSGAKFVKN